ncbi:MAG: phosphoribosyltransferase domain-containing protein [Acutalibacteraceae bacterium]|nr:phosphoribosyltransferase domain-containing protein [Acutalibacteraceae bacterium]
MSEYTIDNVLRIAKRHNNAKRSYLLVNPLQAKHMPVKPSQALEMMHCLGENLYKKYPATKLVVGFAETATAIGAAVAECFDDDCIYIHTTREEVEEVKDWILFLEEHSHAAEQKLSRDNFEKWISNTKSIIFVDDELSTGKTLINMINQLRAQFPALSDVQMIAASIMNRLTKENEDRLLSEGIVSEYLVKLPDEDYTALVENIQTAPATDLTKEEVVPHNYEKLVPHKAFLDPRVGMEIAEYKNNCKAVCEKVVESLITKISDNDSVLVLGTEECMYPAIILGETLEKLHKGNVVCHATTRSPIGICKSEGYPIYEGYLINSFYESDRNTFVYNLKNYDAVVVVSDTLTDYENALNNVAMALDSYGFGKLFYLGGKNA